MTNLTLETLTSTIASLSEDERARVLEFIAKMRGSMSSVALSEADRAELFSRAATFDPATAVPLESVIENARARLRQRAT